MALILSMILSVSFAEEEITVSGRVNAEFYADQALEQNYGITLLLQEYFIRTVEEKDSNIFIVRYEGAENYACVLGRYEVTVDRNRVAGITWSHDGEDTSGGFDAEAWGAEQIMEMLRLNQETGSTGPFDTRVAEINEKHGFNYAPAVLSDEEQELLWNKAEKECEEARKLASLSIKDMTGIARHAVALLYDLPPEREQALEVVVDDEEQSLWFAMYGGEPCYTVCLILDDKEDDDILPNGVRYTEKEGKAAIKKLMTDSPDDPGLEAAQNLYKKVSMLLDYTNEGNDSFAVTEERIAGFQQTKLELKSEYTFDFDWPEADTATLHSIYEPYKSWIDEKKQGKTRNDLNEETFTIGGSVFFGEWPTGAKGSSEAIEWIVLDVHENEILLISKYGLDLQPYHSEIDDAIWQNSAIRAWLNSTFYDNAFSATEKAAVRLTLVDNSAEQGQYDHDGGPNTEDHVFLLSYSEAMKYFASDEDRICNPTPYTRSKGAYLGKNGAGYWWLRSPCDKTFQRKAATVASNGIMWYIFVFDKDRTRSPIDPTTVMVRPAIRISVE